MDIVNKFLSHTELENVAGIGRLRKRAILQDGTILSIQASRLHYCAPRSNDGPYQSVEVGFPSTVLPEIADYAEDPDDPTGTVYGHVPVDLLAQAIERRGGFRATG